jgi:hypothetical protein
MERKGGVLMPSKTLNREELRDILINVSEIVQLIEITSFLVEHVSCSPDGIMEWWNIGMLV